MKQLLVTLTFFGAAVSAALANQTKPGPSPGAQRSPSASVWLEVTDPRWAGHLVGFVACPPSGGRLIAGVFGLGIWKSDSGGVSWSQTGGSISGAPSSIQFDPKDARTFWIAGCHGTGLIKTTDGGSTFTMLGTDHSADGIGVDFTDEYRRTILTCYHERASAMRVSFSAGRTWKDVAGRIPSDGWTMIVLAIDDKNYLVRAGLGGKRVNEGIFRTSDAGQSWIKVSDRIPNTNALVASDGAIYWPTYPTGLVKSTNQGMTWTDCRAPISTQVCELLDKSIVGAAGTRLVISKDGGTTWTPFGPPLPAQATGLAVDPVRRIYLALNFQSGKLYKWTQP